MISIIITISMAISAFISTNIDDIFVLMILFSNKDYKSYEIIMGQYFGFFTLILISLTDYWLKFVVSSQFLAFLGIFPIMIGIKKLLDYYKQKNTHYLSFQEDKLNQKAEKDEISGQKAKKIEENHYYIENLEKFPLQKSFLKKKYGYSSALAVSLITISNGGDNIGIYAPLFASYDISDLLITMALFFVMVGVWCVISQNLVRKFPF